MDEEEVTRGSRLATERAPSNVDKDDKRYRRERDDREESRNSYRGRGSRNDSRRDDRRRSDGERFNPGFDNRRLKRANNDDVEENENTETSTESHELKSQSVVVKKPRLNLDDAALKDRSRRMFGLLRGTLESFSNTPSTEAELRRKEIERKTEERIQAENERIHIEATIEREQTRERIQKERRERAEQQLNELKTILGRQKRMLARSLATKAEPSLRFMPAKLLPHQQEQIDKQIAEAEEAVQELEKKETERHEAREKEIMERINARRAARASAGTVIMAVDEERDEEEAEEEHDNQQAAAKETTSATAQEASTTATAESQPDNNPMQVDAENPADEMEKEAEY